MTDLEKNVQKIEKIVERLTYHEEKLPRIALQNAIDEKEAITPYLLDSIKEATVGIERIYNDSNNMLYFYALYLLSQFREQKAFPLMIDFFSADPELVDGLLNDFITEGVSRALASTYDGNLELLKGLIENEKADEFARGSAKDTLVILYIEGILSREEVIEYFRSLLVNQSFGDNEFLYGSLVSVSADMSADELKSEIEEAFKGILADNRIIGLDSYHKSLKNSHDEAVQALKKNRHYALIDDTIGELSQWVSFGEEKPSSKSVVVNKKPEPKKKIGRNEPCPCGSGKKFKKCCIKKGIY